MRSLTTKSLLFITFGREANIHKALRTCSSFSEVGIGAEAGGVCLSGIETGIIGVDKRLAATSALQASINQRIVNK